MLQSRIVLLIETECVNLTQDTKLDYSIPVKFVNDSLKLVAKERNWPRNDPLLSVVNSKLSSYFVQRALKLYYGCRYWPSTQPGCLMGSENLNENLDFKWVFPGLKTLHNILPLLYIITVIIYYITIRKIIKITNLYAILTLYWIFKRN